MVSTISKALADVTPILTVFYPEKGDAQAQVTCMRVSGSSKSAQDNQSDGQDSAGAVLSSSASAVVVALVALAVFT